MVIDSSVLVAILIGESDRDGYQRAIDASPLRLVSAVTKLETGMIMIGRRGLAAAEEVERLLARVSARIVPFDEHQADIARDAFARYGKGRHKAGLNFGDCAAYALAIAEAEPLLFKGTDFGATDVEVASVADG
jgi:ribonuclease VapC